MKDEQQRDGRRDGWSVVVGDEAATQRLAALLGRIVAPGAVIVLEGDLGAGKTTFVRGLATGLGIDPGDVSSPTFTLIHEYEGDLPLYHFDVYRLDDPAEFVDLGAEEYFARGGVIVVEWGGRVRDELPPQRLEIAIEPAQSATSADPAPVTAEGTDLTDVLGGTARRITFRPLGEKEAGWVEALRQVWEEATGDDAGART